MPSYFIQRDELRTAILKMLTVDNMALNLKMRHGLGYDTFRINTFGYNHDSYSAYLENPFSWQHAISFSWQHAIFISLEDSIYEHIPKIQELLRNHTMGSQAKSHLKENEE